MHKFLRAIGFSKLDRRTLEGIIENIIEHPQVVRVAKNPEGEEFTELSREFAEHIGITVRGIYDEEDRFCCEYYFPCFTGQNITTNEPIEIEKHAEKESYAGVCDDGHLGITLIFYLQNVADYLAISGRGRDRIEPRGAVLAGLSTQGKILLPILHGAKEKTAVNKFDEKSTLVNKAMDGDEQAMASLTMDEIDTYSMLSKRIEKEDILSIVSSTFMPYGIESDQYSILGEILECTEVRNTFSRELVYCMRLQCNGLIFDICINEADLMGMPEPGRRFKGNIWMQGSICPDSC